MTETKYGKYFSCCAKVQTKEGFHFSQEVPGISQDEMTKKIREVFFFFCYGPNIRGFSHFIRRSWHFKRRNDEKKYGKCFCCFAKVQTKEDFHFSQEDTGFSQDEMMKKLLWEASH